MDYTFSLCEVRQHSKKLSGRFCSSCEVQFETAESHQQHYKTEHHKYNLKRRMLNLKPVTEELFHSKKKGKRERIGLLWAWLGGFGIWDGYKGIEVVSVGIGICCGVRFGMRLYSGFGVWIIL